MAVEDDIIGSRRHPRYMTRAEVLVRRACASAPHTYVIRDLSLGGAFVDACDCTLEVGERLYIDFEGPLGDSVTTLATVAWENLSPTAPRWACRKGVGINFIPIDEETEKTLAEWVDRVTRMGTA